MSVRRCFSSSVPRHSRFNRVTADDLALFRRVLGADASAVLTAASETASFTTDWQRKYRPSVGSQSVVLRPKSTAQVAALLKHCNERLLAVVPQGGNTGLVGGSVPVHDEVLLSLSRMNRVLAFNESSSIVTVDAGVVLQQLEEHLLPLGRTVPLDLGAKGSCQIGGNVSTNAGGVRFLRYGSLHGSVSGVEVVLANGDVLDLLSTVRKDNTGFDLKQLFIGAEGTLGVVTKVALVTPPRPKAVNVALFAVRSFADVLALLALARNSLGEVLSAFEYMDGKSIHFVEKHRIAALPIQKAPHYVLLETRGANNEHDTAKLEAILEAAAGAGAADAPPLSLDGTLATTEAQVKGIWALRELIAEALLREGAVYKYDLSLPQEQFYECVEVMQAQFAKHPEVTVCGYGHVGDGNLHLNISAPTYKDEYLALIEPFVYEYIANLRGSISAEHGLGLMKGRHIHYSKPPVAVQLMRQIKQQFDPNGCVAPLRSNCPASVSHPFSRNFGLSSSSILNPYKVLE
jgi:D-2-hydroxyglutarate dehydrogenase